MDLRTALLGCSSTQLARIAAASSLTVESGTLRRELVEALAKNILLSLADAVTWVSLGTVERLVIQQVVRARGRHESELLGRRVRREVVSPDHDKPLETADVDQAIAGLVERGLLFRVFDAEEQRRGVYLVLPDELIAVAARSLGDIGGDLPPSALQPPVTTARCDIAFDLFLLASALRRAAWSAASRGLAGRAPLTTGRVVGLLRETQGDGPGDPGRRWRVLLWLSQRAGWIGRDRWPTPDDDKIERLLTSRQELPVLALSAGPAGDGDGRAEPPGRAGAQRRQAEALQLLSELDPGGWWSASALVSWVADQLIADSDDVAHIAGGRARERSERGRLEAQLGRWLTGRWFWLGLVRWGSDGGGWSLVATTDVLRAFATGRPPPAAPAPRACWSTGRLQFEAPQEADLSALYRVEPYLEFRGGDGLVRRYALTPASFDRGVRLGGDRDEARDLLGRLLGGPIPSEWQVEMTKWTDESARLALSARMVLSSRTEQSLGDALAVPGVRGVQVETVSPRHALVACEDVTELLTELARAGMPVDIDPGLRAEPADVGRAAALADGVAETAWVALEVLRRIAPDAVAEQRDLQTARRALDGVLAVSVQEALARRAATIVTAIANRRRPRARGRVVRG